MRSLINGQIGQCLSLEGVPDHTVLGTIDVQPKKENPYAKQWRVTLKAISLLEDTGIVSGTRWNGMPKLMENGYGR